MATAEHAIDVAQWEDVTPLQDASSWHVEALQTLNNLIALQDNWDGYGSPRIQEGAREGAARLLRILAMREPPAPHIAPVPGGGIQLEWSYNNRELEFEILPDGRLDFLATTESGQMIEDTISDWNRQILHLLNWLITGR